MQVREDEWLEYYQEFRPHCTAARVRPGCQPRKRTRNNARGSVVLVHGLSDSPFYMSAIANHFYQHLGYNVFLPLLHFHGLKKPGGMEGVELEEWKRNVSWAVDQAALLTPAKVSIGGLSTGGALSFYTACTSPRVTGDLLLFSAALSLTVKWAAPLGRVVETLLRRKRLVDFLDKLDADEPLVGEHPVKYAYIDKDGAHELVRLIKEIDLLKRGFDRKHPFPRRVFAAHSYADTTAGIDGIIDLQNRCLKKDFQSFYIDRKARVAHADLVLDRDICSADGERIFARKNPQFDAMMRSLSRFVERG